MDNYIGEIRIFPYNHIPSANKWVPCNGQTLDINQNQALYSLIGIKFGGNGTTNFQLPNLNGRAILGQGTYITAAGSKINYAIGQYDGEEGVTLTTDNMPPHRHSLNAIKNYQTASPSTNFIGNPNIPYNVDPSKQNVGNVNIYAPSGNMTTLSPGSIDIPNMGGKHENRMPYLPIIYCICTGDALYPPRQ